jgi:hypothetical protein
MYLRMLALKAAQKGYVYGTENTSFAIPCGNAGKRFHRFF